MNEPATFEDLAAARHSLGELCKFHRASLEAFRPEQAAWYRLVLSERASAAADEETRHLSTSASCLESLGDSRLANSGRPPAGLVDEFSEGALRRPFEAWESEGAAHTYCRVRTMPLILEQATPALVEDHADVIAEHIAFVWEEVDARLDRQGIREHERDPSHQIDVRYPANAYLTYWGLRTLHATTDHGCLADSRRKVARKRHLALSWAERTIGAQVAFHVHGSEQADPHQLAWAIASVAKFTSVTELVQQPRLDLLRAGLKSFFSQQQPQGGWIRGEPLFHFRDAGNAYCYVYETLMELVRPAVRRAGSLWRQMLQPHVTNLLRAAALAEATKEPIGEGRLGWCSRHHPHRTEPESWATAAAFSFLELLRSLVGAWTRDAASLELGVRTPRWPEQGQALALLRERGDTWAPSGWSAAHQIGSLFLNPVLARAQTSPWLDPDAPLISERQARSAILFGPPGTSKTTLVEALASSLGWDFVEIHASDFLRAGMDNVPARADRIFQLIMELDKCIVLFDEIDELVRDRGNIGSDPYGRFLTTSMLPKLATLWEQRRVLYFLNTNWIDKADPAIRRSQRFDAALFVLPPAFERKFDEIKDLLADSAKARLTAQEVLKALVNSEPNDDPFGWFALLRHDQVAELRDRLSALGRPTEVDDLKAALRQMGDRLAETDWHAEADSPHPRAEADPPHAYERFRRLEHAESLDHRAQRLVKLDSEVNEAPEGFEIANVVDGSTFLRMPSNTDRPPSQLATPEWSADGDNLLWFRVTRR